MRRGRCRGSRRSSLRMCELAGHTCRSQIESSLCLQAVLIWHCLRGHSLVTCLVGLLHRQIRLDLLWLVLEEALVPSAVRYLFPVSNTSAGCRSLADRQVNSVSLEKET